jgi:hypothetical protein
MSQDDDDRAYAAARAGLDAMHHESCLRVLDLAESVLKDKAASVAADLRARGQQPHPSIDEYGRLTHARWRLYDLRRAIELGYVEPWRNAPDYVGQGE